jgi:hypothetical protein
LFWLEIGYNHKADNSEARSAEVSARVIKWSQSDIRPEST